MQNDTEIYESSTAGLTEDELTLFPAASLANLSASPGSEKAQKMTVTSGQKCSGAYKKSSLLGSLVKMCLESSRWNSKNVVLIWKMRAMKSNRLLFQLAPSTPRTEGIGSGLLGTVTAQSSTKGRSEKFSQGNRAPTPHEAIQMLNTPRTTPRSMNYLLPTPNTEGWRSDGEVQKISKSNAPENLKMAMLSRAAGSKLKKVGLIPTPTTPRPHDSNNTTGKYYPTQNQEDIVATVGRETGLKLQPNFVEWMMGYPIGWTGLEDLETP